MSSCACCRSDSNETNVACMLYAFDREERERYYAVRAELLAEVTTRESERGFSFLFPNRPTLLQRIAEWVAFENRCCPFIEFAIFASGDAETLRVDLTGTEMVKRLIRQEFAIP